MTTKEWEKICETFVGYYGQPGQSINIMEARVKRRNDELQLIIEWKRGSNQGCEEIHDSFAFRARGSDLADLIDELRDDILDFECDIDRSKRSQLLRDIAIDYSDAIEEEV